MDNVALVTYMLVIDVVKFVEVPAEFVNNALAPVKYKPLPPPVTIMLLADVPT